MSILVSTVYKVDHVEDVCDEISTTSSSSDLNNYINELITAIYKSESKREFKFASSTTEVASAIYDIIYFIKQDQIDGNVGIKHELIAKRLLRTEKAAQSSYSHITDIQRGVLVQAVTEDTAGKQFIIVKCEHDKFLDEESNYRSKEGLPEKKKVYKALVAEFDSNDDIVKILVYDSQSKISKYWWRDFLDLVEVYSDSQNTKNAFESFEKRIFRPMEKKHKADFINLRNATVKYMQTDGDFDLKYYLDNVIGDYQPIDEKLDISQLKKKVSDLPEGRYKFDQRFTKVPKDIKARLLKTKVKMTEEIDLVINNGIPDINSVIETDKDVHGNKFVKIRSESGYEYFKSNNSDQES